MLCSELYESNISLLFHTTSVNRLYEILDGNEIKANTGHPITHTGGERLTKHWKFRPTDVNRNGYLNGVSLTRSRTFANKWQSRSDPDYNGRAILVLNGDLIKRDFRMTPINFWNGTNAREIDNSEAEEFVIGSIKPLSKYLIHVEVSKAVADGDPLLMDLETILDYHPRIVVKP